MYINWQRESSGCATWEQSGPVLICTDDKLISLFYPNFEWLLHSMSIKKENSLDVPCKHDGLVMIKIWKTINFILDIIK